MEYNVTEYSVEVKPKIDTTDEDGQVNQDWMTIDNYPSCSKERK